MNWVDALRDAFRPAVPDDLVRAAGVHAQELAQQQDEGDDHRSYGDDPESAAEQAWEAKHGPLGPLAFEDDLYYAPEAGDTDDGDGDAGGG